jgi:hypothetical protein
LANCSAPLLRPAELGANPGRKFRRSKIGWGSDTKQVFAALLGFISRPVRTTALPTLRTHRTKSLPVLAPASQAPDRCIQPL